MAVTATGVDTTGSFSKSWTVIATADADTTATIPHGLSGITDANAHVTIVPMTAAGVLSAWQFTSVDATNLVLTKSTAVGSGDAAAQVRVSLWRFHSIND